MDPAELRVAQNDAKFFIEIYLSHFGPTMLHPQPVIRMNRFEPAIRIRKQSFARRTPGLAVGRTNIGKHPGEIASRALEHEENRANVFSQLTEPLFILAQSIIGRAVCAGNPAFLQGALNGRRQPDQAVFHHIIVGAGLQGGDGNFFTYVP